MSTSPPSQLWLALICFVLSSNLSLAEDSVPTFGVFAKDRAKFGDPLAGILDRSKQKTVVFETLESALASKAEVLIFFLPGRDKISTQDVQRLKGRKVIGIGYGSAQVFGQLGLEINGGACAHFGNSVTLTGQKSFLLRKTWENRKVTTYTDSPESDNFGMYLPPHDEKCEFVDAIARVSRDENYAPIVRQNNYVMMGLSASPTEWTDTYKQLFHDVASAMQKAENKEFRLGWFRTLSPGKHEFDLAKGRSVKKASGKEMYFKFKKPTSFTATLTHSGSFNMMMLFMSKKNRLHWNRQDARNGEPLVISCEITENDIRRVGDGYWTLKVTNFDSGNTASCVLTVDYETDKQDD